MTADPGWRDRVEAAVEAAIVVGGAPFALSTPIVENYVDSIPPLAFVQSLGDAASADADGKELAEVEEGVAEPEYGDHADPPEKAFDGLDDIVDIPWSSSPLFFDSGDPETVGAETSSDTDADTDSETEAGADSDTDSDDSGESDSPR